MRYVKQWCLFQHYLENIFANGINVHEIYLYKQLKVNIIKYRSIY